MAEDKVAAEVAEAEFERMCASRRVRTDMDGLSDADRETLEERRSLIVGAIRDGRLRIAEDGAPTYVPPPGAEYAGEAFTFGKPKASHYLAMGAAKNSGAGVVAALAEMTSAAPARLGRLDGQDWNVFVAMLTLFLTPR